MKKLLALLMLLMVSGSIMAQKKTITGKVVNKATNEPMQGVNILANGQKGGAVTKADGSYSISVNNSANTLIFSYVGYTSQTVMIDGKTTIDISMVMAPVSNDEVVIIGYGTQKRSQVTGAVSRFKNEKLDETPVSRLDQALQGKIAGVQIQNISSEAGSEPTIRVRGTNSINAGANPLVVVDGHPVPDGLSFVNMADVESVEVLKDAASAAIYGSRGGAGVILITTKSGKADKPKYAVKFSTGFKTQYELYDMMTTTEYTNLLFYEAALKAQDPSIPTPTGTGIISNNERAAYVIESTLMNGQATDWQKEALRNGLVQNVQMNVSGGSKTLKYFVSGAYQKDQGMMYHSEYDRYSIRAKLDAQLNKKMKLSFNFNPSYIKRERPSTGFIDFVRFQSYLPVYHTDATAAFVNQVAQWSNIRPGDYAQARHFNGRVYTGLMPDGSMWVTTSATDPFNTANNTPKSVLETRTITSDDYRMMTSGDMTYTILKGLDFKSLVSSYVSYSQSVDFAKRNSNREGDVNRGQYNNRLYVDLLWENTLTYTKKIKEHSFTFLAGFTAQKTNTKIDQIVGLDFPSDNITTANNARQIELPTVDASGNLQGTYNFKGKEGLLSYLGRITYAYANKYLLAASIRSDGSSNFAPGNKWESFPSVSVGWVASEESFLKDVSWISNLKLRGSAGASGKAGQAAFPYLDLLYSANYPLGAGTGTTISGLTPSSVILGNPNITWERTFQYNGGIDLGLFNNRFILGVDVYESKSDRLLLQQSAMGFTGVPLTWNNIGKLQNKGVEVELTSNNFRKKDFTWSTSVNFSRNRNKVLQLGEEALFLNQGERTELYMNKVGAPLIQFFGYKTDGVWLSQAQIDEARANGLTSNLSNVFVPGGLKLVDVDGDGDIDADDRVVTGSPYPNFTWGVTNNLKYKAFDLSFMFQGVQGGQLINGDPNYNETKRYNRNYNKNRWLSPDVPRGRQNTLFYCGL
ncbi:MAG: SusC/RagA family TonB-linked outer membrane protein [Ferruginibacter sp.]